MRVQSDQPVILSGMSGPRRPSSAARATNRLLWYRLPAAPGAFDAAQVGQGVRGFVQHDLHDRAASGRQQLAGDEQLGCAGPVLAVEDPPLGPVVAAQPVALGGALLIRPGPGDDDHVGDVRVLVLDRGPGALQRGDDAASVLFDGPGFGHGRASLDL